MLRMKHAVWVIAGSLILCAAAGSAVWARANVDRHEETIRFDDLLMFNPCAGEMMELEGEYSVRCQIVATPNGGKTVTVHQRVRAQGFGVDSGERYVVNDRSSETKRINPNNEQKVFTFRAGARMIAPGHGPNAHVTRTVTLVVDANGEIRVDVDEGLAIECR